MNILINFFVIQTLRNNISSKKYNFVNEKVINNERNIEKIRLYIHLSSF